MMLNALYMHLVKINRDVTILYLHKINSISQ